MKVLHILYSGLGGHGNVFFSMVQADENNEYKFKAIFNGIEDVRQEYIDRCNKLQIPFTFVKKKPGKHILFFLKILREIWKNDSEIIFLHGSILILPAVLAKFASLSRRKIIVRETQAIHLKSIKEKLALKLSMQLASKIIFLSEEYKNEIKSIFRNKFKNNKVSVIPNGIDLNLFYPYKTEKDINVINIGMQSRIVPIKDHKTLIEAFALLIKKYPSKKLILKIAGDGESLKEVKELVIKHDLIKQISFLGMLPELMLPQFLNDLTIYVHASFGETMSTAIMQAMACGKPIIASDVPGINNMIKNNETGILIPVLNSLMLANAFSQLIEDNSLKEKLENASELHAQKYFSNRIMFQKYSNLFQQ